MKPSDGLQNGSFNIKTQNLELVNLKCVIFTPPVILSLRAYLVLERGCLLLTQINMFCVWKFKNIYWEHVKFDERKSYFLPFFVVYHILSETELWTFSTSSSMNSLEMQH